MAREHTPSDVRSRGAAAEGQRPLQVRVYANQDYRAQTRGWRGQVAELLSRASHVTGPDLGSPLHLLEAAPWEADSDDLDALLVQLAREDSGDDADLVIGLVGSLPTVSTDIHALGRAQILGKHLVLRAANDVAEAEAIDSAFPTLGDEEKRELTVARKEHRELVVFLHEVGHSLGAIHVSDSRSLMHAVYSSDADGFSHASLALARPTLAERLRPAEEQDFARLRDTLVAVLDAHPDAWAEAERQAYRSFLEEIHQAPEPEPAPAIEGLDESESRVFAEASRLLQAGEIRQAWAVLAPMVEARPDHFQTQEMACRMKMAGLSEPLAGRACQLMMSLAQTHSARGTTDSP